MGVKFTDEYWMREALELAQSAVQEDEVPVGALLIQNNVVIASATNKCIQLNDPSAHAEMLAMRAAAQKLNNYRLNDTTLYVTLEPCMMCAGAMLHARIEKVVFGAFDLKTGVAGGCFDWLMHEKHMHKLTIKGGILEEECGALIRKFFADKR